MPREKEFESNADRQRAYRERKRLELEAERSRAEQLDQGLGVMEFEGEWLPVVRRCSWDEETYVRHELAVTKAQIASGAIKTKDAKGHDLEPLRRSEEYLRWRYRGFRVGEIAAL